ncbi:MAG TPA: hypothetical protein VE754_00660 [Actinomycetota bacterium]|jgi:hypothetical protein|nr:hypothetical protein [Actinomycetota bacterium]
MAYDEHGHTHQNEPVDGGGLTAFAVVKYGFILIITIVVLYFIARYLIPLFD